MSHLKQIVFSGLLIGALLIGCAAEPTEVAMTLEPTPTVNALLVDVFKPAPTAQANAQSSADAQSDSAEQVANFEPTVAAIFVNEGDVQLVATPTKRPLAASQSQLNLVSLGFGADATMNDRISEVLVFDDELDTNWTLANSANVRYDPVSTARWYEQLDTRMGVTSGAMSIALKPEADYGQLYFTVQPGATEVYHRDDILGVSFWMYTGTNIVDTGDFAVTIVGSNQQHYWTPDDRSVFFQGDDSFSETALYFLDINRAVPADSWVKIEVWLDDLLFDPDYQFITGVYIKNDAGYRNQVYIDRLALLKERGA